MSPTPLVTCLCLTRNRREWLPKAIACFESQGYENRELLIVVDDESDARDLIPTGARIHMLIVGPGQRVIGNKRNVGCVFAAGEIIAHWDDDDFSAPCRLADQVTRLLEEKKAVTGYHSLRFTDGHNWWAHDNPPSWAFGTSLCYRRDWWAGHRFPPLQIGEDAAFVTEAVRCRQLVTAAAGEMMYATNHPGNTSQRTIGEGWRPLPELSA